MQCQREPSGRRRLVGSTVADPCAACIYRQCAYSRSMKRGAGWVNCSIFLLGAIFIVRASAQSDPCLGLTASFNPNSNTVDLRFGGEVGVAYTIESSADLQTWIPVRTNNGPANPNPLHIDASADQAFYRVSRPLLPIFSYVLTTKSTLQFQGNNVYVDSYDSADPVYRTARTIRESAKLAETLVWARLQMWRMPQSKAKFTSPLAARSRLDHQDPSGI